MIFKYNNNHLLELLFFQLRKHPLVLPKFQNYFRLDNPLIFGSNKTKIFD